MGRLLGVFALPLGVLLIEAIVILVLGNLLLAVGYGGAIPIMLTYTMLIMVLATLAARAVGGKRR